MAARFWVGGTGNWDATTTTNWALTSGGAGGASVPVAADTVTFDTNSGTGTVTLTAAASVTSVAINKSGLTLVANAVLTISGDMGVTTGSLDMSSGQTCTWASLTSNNSNVRSISLGASHLTLTSNTQPLNFATSTNLTFSCGTSLVTFSGTAPALIALGSQTFYDVQVSNTGSANVGMTGNNTFHNCTILGGNSTAGSLSTNGMTVTGTLTITGNSIINRVLINSNNVGSRRTITAAVAVITNVTFQDITAAGTAAPFSGTNLDDAQGNSNITFDDPQVIYRIGAGGVWSSTTQWSSTSGGVSGQRVPLAQDNVIIDTGASGTITVDVNRLGKTIDTSGFAGTLSMSAGVTILGSLIMSNDPAFAVSGTNAVTLSGRGTQLVTSSGKTFGQSFKIDAPGGIYSLQDNFVSTNSLTLTNGTFDANNNNVTVPSFNSSAGNNVRQLKLGSGTWTINGTGVVWNITSNVALGLIPSTSTIVLTDTSAVAKTFTGGGRTYHNLTVATGASASLTMGGSTFSTLTILAGAVVLFTAATTTTVTDFSALGVSGTPISISSTTAGTAFTLTKPSGIVVCDYLVLKDSTAAGLALWYAGAHSTNVSGNTGWQFTQPSTGFYRFFEFLDGGVI